MDGYSRSCITCGGDKDSSDWTQLEPKVTREKPVKPTFTRENMISIYSLQSEAGRFECSVSGLRWVCQENVSIKYQFRSWWEHAERLERLHYAPGGPLLDITIIAGKVDEVHLPHWICLNHNPTISEKFAALHVTDDGDIVEQVSEVTPFHIKLFQPTITIGGVLIRAIFPEKKVHCNTLMYTTNRPPNLTAHVYVFPDDPFTQQTVKNEEEESYGNKRIQKLKPYDSFHMEEYFVCTTEPDIAEIYPDRLTLRHIGTPNYFEVYIRNADTDFKLQLKSGNDLVWNPEIRKADYQFKNWQRYLPARDRLFSARPGFVKGVCEPVLAYFVDILLQRMVINEDEMTALTDQTKTTPDRAGEVIDMLRNKGDAASAVLIELLCKEDPHMADCLNLN